MNKIGSIYRITNKLNGMSYVGQTTQPIERRFKQHTVEKRYDCYIHNAIQKYGKDNFLMEEIAVCFDVETLNYWEQLLISNNNTLYPNGYNLRSGGNQNGFCSDELKAKISKAKTGVPVPKRRGIAVSDIQRTQISKTLGGQYILGTEIATGRSIIFMSSHEAGRYGFEPWNVIAICKGNGRRKVCHGYTFKYFEKKDYANQSGRGEEKNSRHAQRLGDEPAYAEYNSGNTAPSYKKPTSPRPPTI